MASVNMASIHPAGDLHDYARKKPSKQAVSISRKDTIIIAMLVNIALLAVLFATATRKAPETTLLTISQPTVQAPVAASTAVSAPIEKLQALDEIDEILKTYARKASEVEVKAAPTQTLAQTPAQTPVKVVREAPQKKAAPKAVEKAEFYIVQSGDSPWKIAKKCNIKVEDLLRLNNLDEEKARNLKIGQKLRIR
jgi:LysM repeat protein